MAPRRQYGPPRSVVLPGLLLLLLLGVYKSDAQSLGELKRMPRPPEMLQEPQQLAIYKIGEDLKLDCRASGEPEPTYYWELNAEYFDINGQDNRVTQQPNEGTIVFNNPKKKDEGVYQCFAQNQHGTAASQNVVLQTAQLDEFEPIEAPSVYSANVGDSLRLRCTPPKSIPNNPEITWEKYYKFTGEIVPVILNNRITKDSYGDLYFVSIKKEDQLIDSGEYRCSVFNTVQRKSVAGMRYQIQVSGDTALSSPPELMWATQDNRPIGMRGEKLVLKCIFSGEPIPKVIWNRASGGPKGEEPRVTTDSFGQELVFNSVEFGDTGRYECAGSNSQTANAQTKPFDLKVESKPFWVQKPQNVETGEGETVTFICKAEGIPIPDVKWYINGKPIATAPENARRYSSGNNVTYVSVTTDDAQVLQCNASNNYGYVFANAYLNVIRSEPLWKLPPMPSVTFAEGQNKNLTCETYAGPRAEVSWVKDGVYLTGGRHIVHRDGNLEIQRIVTTDAGTYTCTAKNIEGQLQGTSLVRVAQPTLIVTAPEDMMVTAGEEAKFICTAVTDPSFMDKMQIIWKKYSNIIDTAQSGRVFQNLMDNSLTITDVNEQDAALYTCEARTNLDSASARAFLRVRDVPNPPEIKEVKCTSNRTVENKIEYFAEIRFTPRGSNYAPINKFTVEYSTDFSPDAWSVIHTTDSTNPANVKLSPYGNYTFRVVAWNFIGESEPSPASTQICRTEPDAPSVQPKNVKGEGTKPSNMVISWTPILPIEHNGAGFKYEITWNCTDPDCRNDETNRGQATVVDYNVNTVVVETLPPYHRYEIKVTCRNEKGTSSAEAFAVVGYSGEFKPTEAPTGLELEPNAEVGSSSVTLKWIPIENTTPKIGGYLVGYVVRFFRRDEGMGRVRYELIQLNDPEKRFEAPSTHAPHGGTRRKRSLTATDIGLPSSAESSPTLRRFKRDTDVIRESANEMVVTIHNLPANSNVELSVAVFNTRYYGPFSPSIVVQTKEGPPGPVDYFAVKRRNANMVKVEWIPPVDPNGEIIGYDFAHRELIGLNLGDRSWDAPVTDPNLRHHNISGLKPEQMYRVYIYAKTVAGRGDENFLDVSTTGAGAPQPPQFDVNNITDHSMNVTWSPSALGNPGSVFYVQYRKSGKTEWEMSAIETEYLHVELLSMSAGTTYAVRVIAQNGYTAEAASPTKWYTTTGSTNALSFVIGEPWFILMFLIVLILCILLAVLLLCKDKLKREYPPTQEEEQLNDGYDSGPYHPGGGYNVAFSKSGESLHKQAPEHRPGFREPEYSTNYPRERDYYPAEQAPDYYPPERSAEYYPEKSRDYHPEKAREYDPDRSVDYYPETSGEYYPERAKRHSERAPAYGEERPQMAPAYAPHDEPAPVMYMPTDSGPSHAPPPRYDVAISYDDLPGNISTSTEV